MLLVIFCRILICFCSVVVVRVCVIVFVYCFRVMFGSSCFRLLWILFRLDVFCISVWIWLIYWLVVGWSVLFNCWLVVFGGGVLVVVIVFFKVCVGICVGGMIGLVMVVSIFLFLVGFGIVRCCCV